MRTRTTEMVEGDDIWMLRIEMRGRRGGSTVHIAGPAGPQQLLTLLGGSLECRTGVSCVTMATDGC
jgi:hypothetical protein